jgi:hypothetical protein
MPELFEPRRVGGGVLDGVLDVAMPEVILNEPLIRALVGQGEAASVAEHMRMGAKGQGRRGAVFFQKQIDGRAVQRPPLFAHKERVAGRLHPLTFF